MNNLQTYRASSIGRKQIVATTGLLLILYVIGHLAGNLLFYAGPDVFNGYARKLAGLRPGLYVIEAGLAAVFLIHIYMTALLVLENIRARGHAYKKFHAKGERSWATRLMPYTGVFLLAFVVWHIWDFTLTDHHGPRSVIGGVSYGLYGVVYNSFADPVHSAAYVIGMAALGFHLSHGVRSFIQTFGFEKSVCTATIENVSTSFAIVIALGFSSIPVYVLVQTLR